MSIFFWRKTRDLAPENAQAVAVTEDTPLPVQIFNNEDEDPARVQVDQNRLPPVAGETRLIGPYQIPGIGTGAAYADGDAFGTVLQFHDCFRPERCSGTIVAVLFFDLDDEGVNKDIPFFIQPITATADNSAFAPSDIDLLAWRGTISISSYNNWGNNQAGQDVTTRLWIKSDSPHLWTQIVTRGADNIAAGAIPWIALVVAPD